MEKGQDNVPRDLPVAPALGRTRPKAKGKPMAKSIATPSHTSLPDGDDDWDIEPEMYNPATMSSQGVIMPEDMNALPQRMLHIETALTRVIAHIENQAIQHQEYQENNVQ